MQKNNKKNSCIAVSISLKQGNSFRYIPTTDLYTLKIWPCLLFGRRTLTAEKVWLEYSRTFSYYYKKHFFL